MSSLFNRKGRTSSEQTPTKEEALTPGNDKLQDKLPPYPAPAPPSTPTTPSSDLTFRKEAARIEKMIVELASAGEGKAPSWMVNAIKSSAPLVTKLMVVLHQLSPFFIKAYDTIKWLNETLPMDLLAACWGLVLCFFGGTFAMSLAAYEAFKLSGWDSSRAALMDLNEEFVAYR